MPRKSPSTGSAAWSCSCRTSSGNVQPYDPVLREVRWSPFIVAALVVIGVVASVDAFRGGADRPRRERTAPPESTATTTERAPTPAETLSAAGVTGTLYFTLSVDEGCVLHTLLLPGLDDGGAFLVDRCEFDVSPQGNIVTGSSCPGGVVEVGPAGGVLGPAARVCARLAARR